VSSARDPLAELYELTELAAAFRGSSETALESRQQGAAFLDVTRKAWPHPTLDAFAGLVARPHTRNGDLLPQHSTQAPAIEIAGAFPTSVNSIAAPTTIAAHNAAVSHSIAVAVACAAHNVALVPALHAYLHAVTANLVSAGARLIPLGQTHAQIAIAQLAPTMSAIIERALPTSLDHLGTASPAVELCSLRHETQYTRLFRS
jgi:urease accessory protein